MSDPTRNSRLVVLDQNSLQTLLADPVVLDRLPLFRAAATVQKSAAQMSGRRPSCRRCGSKRTPTNGDALNGLLAAIPSLPEADKRFLCERLRTLRIVIFFAVNGVRTKAVIG